MHRFFVSPESINNEQVRLPFEIAHQIRNVLRLRPNESIIVLDNHGDEYEVVLRQVEKQQVVGDVVVKRPSPNEPTVQLTLYQSMMKRDKFEWVLQKGTEIGVSHFVPMVTQRSLVQKVDIKNNKQVRWQKIITEAAEQSRRGRLPTLHSPQTLSQAVAHAEGTRLIAWEEASGLSLGTALANLKRPSSISLFIGPEGGFAAQEIAVAEAAGFQPITLGKRILRAETAALVATALILHELNEI